MAVVLVPLVANFNRFAAGTSLQRDVYAAASKVLVNASGNPQVMGVTIDGAAATITVHTLTRDPKELADLIIALARATDLQVSLVDG